MQAATASARGSDMFVMAVLATMRRGTALTRRTTLRSVVYCHDLAGDRRLYPGLRPAMLVASCAPLHLSSRSLDLEPRAQKAIIYE